MENNNLLNFMSVIGAAISGERQQIKRYVNVRDTPEHTKNLFGDISEVAGKRLEVLSCNFQGDCMCLFTGAKGQNLVDVDHRDITEKQEAKE